MSIEILSLTDKGIALSRSRRQGFGQHDLWATIYFISKMGNRTTSDRIVTMVFDGNERVANKAIGELKQKNVIVGE